MITTTEYPQILSHLGVRISTHKFWRRHKNSVHIMPSNLSIYSNFSFVTQKVMDTEMKLGKQAFWGNICERYEEDAESGRGSLKTVLHVAEFLAHGGAVRKGLEVRGRPH